MPGGKKWFDVAEDILEKILAEAEAERSDEYDDSYPYKTIRHSVSPELADIERAIPGRIKLSYRLTTEDWEDWDEDGTLLEDQCWDADLLLSTDGVPQMIYRRCENTLEKFLSTNIVTDREGNKKRLLDALSPDIRASLLEAYAEDAIFIYYFRLKEKLGMAFIEHSIETHFLASVRLRARVAVIAGNVGGEGAYDIKDPLGEMKRLLAEATSLRRRFLKEDIETSLALPNFVELGAHYNKLLPVWQDAKTIYKQNSNRATWRDIVRIAHPDVEFDDDLISRLSGKLNDLPEDVQAKLSEKGGNSKPSSIALENAARLCGARPYQYSLRHLYNIKNEMGRRFVNDGEENND